MIKPACLLTDRKLEWRKINFYTMDPRLLQVII